MRRRFEHPDQFNLSVPETEAESEEKERIKGTLVDETKASRKKEEKTIPTPTFMNMENGERISIVAIEGQEDRFALGIPGPDGENHVNVEYSNTSRSYVALPGEESLLNQPYIDKFNQLMREHRLRKSEDQKRKRSA